MCTSNSNKSAQKLNPSRQLACPPMQPACPLVASLTVPVLAHVGPQMGFLRVITVVAWAHTCICPLLGPLAAATLACLMLQFYPHFSTFLNSCDLMCPQFPHHPPICSCYVPSIHGTYPHLCHTHMHYPICLCSCLVPYGCAVASYHIPLTCLPMTYSSPLRTIHLPIWYAFWSSAMFQIHHISPSSEALCFLL